MMIVCSSSSIRRSCGKGSGRATMRRTGRGWWWSSWRASSSSSSSPRCWCWSPPPSSPRSRTTSPGPGTTTTASTTPSSPSAPSASGTWCRVCGIWNSLDLNIDSCVFPDRQENKNLHNQASRWSYLIGIILWIIIGMGYIFAVVDVLAETFRSTRYD